MGAVGRADRRPIALFVMQPTRMPAARLLFGDVGPKRIDGTREFERLETQRGSHRRFFEFQTEKPVLDSRQVYIAAFAARRRRGVQRFPAPRAVRAANSKAG